MMVYGWDRAQGSDTTVLAVGEYVSGVLHIRALKHVEAVSQLPPRGLRLPAQRGYCDTCAIEAQQGASSEQTS